MGRVRNSGQESHRAGPLKQANKKHKTGRHRSKGVIDVETRGRVSSVGSVSKRNKTALSRSDRRKQATAIRDKRMFDVIDQKRRIGGQRGAPICISIIPLSSCSNPGLTMKHVLDVLKNDIQVLGKQNDSVVYLKMKSGKNVTLVVPPSKELWALLDTMKMSDVTLFHVPVLEPLGTEGITLLKAAKEQGIITPFIGTTTPFSKVDEKMFVKSMSKLFIPVSKVYLLQNSSQVLNAFRMMTVSKQIIPKHWALRSSLLIENSNNWTFTPDIVDNVLPTLKSEAKSINVLQVVGTVRRQNLNPKQMVHVSGVGDFRILRVDISPIDSCVAEEKCISFTPPSVPPRYMYDPTIVDQAEDESVVESQADSGDDQSMISESDAMDMAIETIFGNNPKAGQNTAHMAGSSSGPTNNDEEFEDKDDNDSSLKKRMVPKGTSSYQADWLDGSDSEGGSLIDSDEDVEQENDSQEEDMDEDEMDWGEEQEQLKIARAARTEAEFPDWIDTPMDVPAKERFQRYRGLQSFKKSPWDPYENLPREYSKIFQFHNFRHSYKKIIGEEQDGPGFIPVGQRVSILLTRVDDQLQMSDPNSVGSVKPLAMFSQLRYENKMSVLNLQLNVSDVLKNKEELIFQIGFRRFQAKPILSDISPGNKHKMLRFAQPNTSCMATVFAPIVFPTASVLVFKKSKSTLIPIGSGSVFSVDPTRVVVKRVLLSGYPVRSHGRKATVRFMFFNREDITWFKPVELRTRYGQRGHIREPLGTHGRMKCIFDGPIKSQDTILMPLYKRVFPKMNYDPFVIPYTVYDNYEIRSSVLSAF